jgi:hypothetical protein
VITKRTKYSPMLRVPLGMWFFPSSPVFFPVK